MITLENLGKATLENQWIFRGLHLHVAAHQSIAIMGRSGCGKSLLLKLIAGLTKPTEGKIFKQTQELGMLFQKNALFDSMTVQQNLTFPLIEKLKLSHRQARAKATQFLAHVGLSSASRLYPNQISGGMQKRLGIARALIVEPQLILYDEPTAGLDPITGRSIVQLMRLLQEEMGSTLITVSNEIQRVYQLADEIFFFSENKTLLSCGSPKQAQTEPLPEFKSFVRGKIHQDS